MEERDKSKMQDIPRNTTRDCGHPSGPPNEETISTPWAGENKNDLMVWPALGAVLVYRLAGDENVLSSYE